jgi:hypothetical protein
MPSYPAEPERRCGFVLFGGNRLDRASGSLGDLSAPPESERDCRGQPGVEPDSERRQREEDEEDRDDDREPSPDLDVEPDRGS